MKKVIGLIIAAILAIGVFAGTVFCVYTFGDFGKDGQDSKKKTENEEVIENVGFIYMYANYAWGKQINGYYVDVDVAELEGTSAETKATYEKIKKYVAEHNDGMKVSNLYIAQVKRKCGLELAENFNLPKSEDSRQPQCPKEKEEAIVEALKAFQMV